MTAISGPERRISLTIVVLAVAFGELVLVLSPATFPSYDEAKYVGIGYQVLAGRGPLTLLGELFLPHSPLWPIVVDAPSVWFGVDPLSWGHLLTAVAMAGLLLLTAWFGWAVRPAVGAAAAAAYVGYPYLFELTRTTRLDVPAAALCLAYVALALVALDRRSIRLGLAAGLVFGLAFLIKEIALPFAPVPFIVAFARGTTWRAMGGVLAAIVLVAAIVTAWWFAMYASETGLVYRLGTPAWTLGPLVLGAALLIVGGFVVGRRAGSAADRPWPRRRAVAWGLALAWFVLLTVFFEVQGTLQGTGLLQLSQYRLYAATWLPNWPMRIVFVAAVLGALGALVRLLRGGPGRERDGIELLTITLVCSFPLVLLVFAVGEPPRNYLAQIGLFIALAAAGWVGGVERLAVRVLARGHAEGEAAGLPSDQRPLPAALVGTGLAVVLLGSVGIMSVYAVQHRDSPTGTARAEIVDDVTAWIRGNVPTDEAIGFGPYLGYELALPLRGDWPMSHYVQRVTVADPSATYGLRPLGGPDGQDWLGVDGVGRRALQYSVFQAGSLARAIKAADLRYLVYVTGTSTSVPSLTGALTPEHGFTPVASWHVPAVGSSAGEGAALDAVIYLVDPAKVDFTGAPIWITASALERLIERLEAAGDAGRAAAAQLAERVGVYPADPSTPSLMARLHELAGQ